jgi:predicted GNAT family acetyltransferase
MHPLDRPVWSTLTTRQAQLSRGEALALQFDPAYGPFAAAMDRSPKAVAALSTLEPGEDGLWLVEPEPQPAPPGLAVAANAECVQMIAGDIARDDPAFPVTDLGEADAPQMLALARLTRPGPFFERTHQLGRFVGVKQGDRLVAMAGERMRPDGFVEVSGVCSHPDHRGRGYAKALMSIVASRILDEGETPFLHAYASNAGAIELYRAIGFSIRRTVVLTVLKPRP